MFVGSAFWSKWRRDLMWSICNDLCHQQLGHWSLICLVSGNDCGAAVMSEFFASQSPPGGFCLQCLLNTLSSASLLPVWIAISVSLIASAVILARRRFRASPMSSTPHKNQLRIEKISSSWFVGLNSTTETRMLRSDPVELRDS